MKHKLTVMFLIVLISNAFSQGRATKWSIPQLDSLTVAQSMFDDQNFVLALAVFSKLQAEHPDVLYLKYSAGICCLFKTDSFARSLELLSDVYSKNKHAENIEYYLARAYHYNNKFDEAIAMLEKYLLRKNLTEPQKRNALLLMDYCHEKKILVPPADEGKLEDYKWGETDEEGGENNIPK